MIKLLGNPVSYVYHYFNLFHCLLVCPYTFVYNSKNGAYKLQTHCLIQIFSFIITLFSFFNPMKKLYISIFDPLPALHPMMNLLELVKASSECVYVLAISHTLWCRKNDLYGIVNLLQSPDGTFKYSFEQKNSKAKLYVGLIALIVSATVTLNTIELYDSWGSGTGSGGGSAYSGGAPGGGSGGPLDSTTRLGHDEAVTRVLFAGSQFMTTVSPAGVATTTANGSSAEQLDTDYNSLLNKSTALDYSYDEHEARPAPGNASGISNHTLILNDSDGGSIISDFTGYKILILVLYFFENNFVQLVYCFGDWLMIIISLVLRDAVNRLEQVIEDTSSTAAQVLDYYEALKALSRRINQVFGFLVFAFTVGSIPLFVTSLLTVMNPKSPALLMRDLIYFFNFFYFLFMAVFIDKKSTLLEEWLLVPKNYAQLPSSQMAVLLHEMKAREIGFHGLGLFKVSAGLLGMTINLILTFSIIFLQFNMSRSGNVEF